MTDYFGFTMAALNENGSVLANPKKGDKTLSTLMYRPFSSWANNSEVSLLTLHCYLIVPFINCYAKVYGKVFGLMVTKVSRYNLIMIFFIQ